jgi:hypothetical protein
MYNIILPLHSQTESFCLQLILLTHPGLGTRITGRFANVMSPSSFCTAYTALCCNAIFLSRCFTLHCFQHFCDTTTRLFIARVVNVYSCTSASLSCLVIKTKRQGHSLSTSHILITFTQIGKTRRKISVYTVAAHAIPQKYWRSCNRYFVLLSMKGVMDEK